MTQEFISPERRKAVKHGVEAAVPGWTLGQVRKDARMGVWLLKLRRQAPEGAEEAGDAPEVPVNLGDVELDGLVEGGPAGERAQAKVRKAVQLRGAV